MKAIGKITTQATSATTVRRIAARRAIKLELAGAKMIDARAGDGETGKFAGKIERLPGLEAPVTVTLAGLPKEYPAPKVVVPADQNEFELAVRFPKTAKPGELKNVQLIASVAVDENDPKSRARSNSVPVTVKVVAADN